jgi:putative radical SAM enzyme (TIGR03279 family)
MKNIIIKVEKKSIAEELGILPGDILLSINGVEIQDVFDYRMAIFDEFIELEIQSPDGSETVYEIEKEDYEDIGIIFESGLMDNAKSCTNKCIFCFIDRLPKGMRDTLYFKDDDSRLSFLSGNYVTLTNMSDDDMNRIIRHRLSPINISVHTTDPNLREFMLKNPNSKNIIHMIEKLYDAGISMNYQIVLVKGVNDGQHLDETINDLVKYIDFGSSLSVVPVGLTRHEDGLFPIEPFSPDECKQIIEQVDNHGKIFKQKYGNRFVYAADELYIRAGINLPEYSYYDDFPQLENGVGMISLMENEFDTAIKRVTTHPIRKKHISVLTGAAAYDFICGICKKAEQKFPDITITPYKIINEFFGENITVSGLLTGGDIIAQLKGKPLGDVLLMPKNALRDSDVVFLDDVTVTDVSDALGVLVRAVEVDGKAFLDEVLC